MYLCYALQHINKDFHFKEGVKNKERFLDMEEVAGSNPVGPTLDKIPRIIHSSGSGGFYFRQKVRFNSMALSHTTI